jgi:ABC-2 type transport system ATP-binding protein
MTTQVPLQTTALGKRYGKRWAIRDCSLEIPAGSVTALIGPNGTGKSTLLRMVVGLGTPTEGSVAVFGNDPRREQTVVLPQLGYVAQERPLYSRFSVDEMFKVGEKMNSVWDRDFAEKRAAQLGIGLRERADKLSGGQQAQISLILALAKHPALLVLDEPTASLDPLARREFLQVLMEAVAVDGTTVVMSSHNVPDVERVCDHLVILSKAKVQVAESLDTFLSTHRTLVGPRASNEEMKKIGEIVHASSTDRQTTLLVRQNGHLYDPRWDVREVGFEEIVLAYLAQPGAERARVAEASAS